MTSLRAYSAGIVNAAMVVVIFGFRDPIILGALFLVGIGLVGFGVAIGQAMCHLDDPRDTGPIAPHTALRLIVGDGSDAA